MTLIGQRIDEWKDRQEDVQGEPATDDQVLAILKIDAATYALLRAKTVPTEETRGGFRGVNEAAPVSYETSLYQLRHIADLFEIERDLLTGMVAGVPSGKIALPARNR
jgi:hypothetical protein